MCIFLVSQNLVLKKFGSLYKLSTIAKTKTFRELFSILLLIFDEDGFFFKNTHTHLILGLVVVEKISAEKMKSRDMRGGKLFSLGTLETS